MQPIVNNGIMSHKHVLANIHGGLGNQMFMYAVARALSKRIGADLLLEYDDTGNLDGYGRLYELEAFNISGEHPSWLSYRGFVGKLLRQIYTHIGVKLPFIPMTVIKESDTFQFDSSILSVDAKNINLVGYWQSEKYFKDFENLIRSDFEYKIQFPDYVEKEKQIIHSYGDRAVAFCVRRYQEVKQFVHLKRTEKDYYLKALDKIKIYIKNPVLFCFSQTPEWVKEEFSDCGIEIIYIKPKSGVFASHEDMYLLRSFRNYIISNSSYYWWGAWLSSAKDKLVISPDNWCCNESNCLGWIIIQ